MSTILWIGIGTVVAIIVSLFFEEGREWYSETFQYLITFEWLSDLWGFVTGLFEDLGEFSFIGILFAVIGMGLIFALRGQMLEPFLVNMPPLQATFWGGATYIGTGIAGYLMGKKMSDD